MVVQMQCSTHAVHHISNAVQRISLGVALRHIYVTVVVAAVAVDAAVVAAASAAAAV
jgi:predicted nuclease with TOPRIM domain